MRTMSDPGKSIDFIDAGAKDVRQYSIYCENSDQAVRIAGEWNLGLDQWEWVERENNKNVDIIRNFVTWEMVMM